MEKSISFQKKVKKYLAVAIIQNGSPSGDLRRSFLRWVRSEDRLEASGRDPWAAPPPPKRSG